MSAKAKATAAVKAATERVVAAKEPIEDALERILRLELNAKERRYVELAKTALLDGSAERTKSGKMSKAEPVEIGKAIAEQQEIAERERRIKSVVSAKPANYLILRDDSELPGFIERVREECRRQREEWPDRFDRLGVASMTAGDFEGTGIDPYIDMSIGFSIWLPLLNEGYYLPYGHVDVRDNEGFDFLTDKVAHKADDKQLTRSKVIAAITPYMGVKNHGKTFHMGAARYDLHVAQNDGYTIRGCVWDTLDAMYTLNEHEESYGLKPLTQKYGSLLGVDGDVYTFEDLFGSRSPAPFDIEVVGIYAIKDVLYGWRLFEWQFEMMRKTDRLMDCYSRIDSQLPETDVFMERSGFDIDIDGLRELEREFTGKIKEARAKVFESYGINDDFIRKMDRTISHTKINKWIEAQQKKIATLKRRISAKKKKVAELKEAKKTHTKGYANEVDMLRKYERELSEFPEPTEDNAPQFVESFEMTNGNHLAYLMYDHVGVEDKTYRIKRGKKRSTAADVLEIYYEDEPALEPLATVAEYEKLLNTYIRPILGTAGNPSILEIDGKLHSNFKAGGTATGRYSSAAYNGRPVDVLEGLI